MEKRNIQKAAFMTLVLMVMGSAWAAPGAVNVGSDPVGVFRNIGCWIVGILSSPALVAVAGAILLLTFGWGKLAGEMNAFTNFKNGVIGAVIVLSAAAISTALFGAGCAAPTGG
ncbi:hypothetical protein ACFP9V_22735 [Deinococcus radiopugnans]|uniref:Type IV secretory pathway VirB2 component (Pilin) n=1 Tax=Deinococcus radiopugnans ATCC 19172 TaxID=585398 RepID=A0A5C4Y5L0_9DEIO|nr:hypothetical protein [Deinococcus radiopugnans]MBB6017078.1 type IV secretory pathway VirB2 component (pilin) [Deinococcus radiopugnans ATCC 19172]TNM70688.1 hypothetical protein FHR04_12370 [Deinococcus radiopugnans ATCC 19172]